MRACIGWIQEFLKKLKRLQKLAGNFNVACF